MVAAFDPFARGRRAKDPCRRAKEHLEIWLLELVMQPVKRPIECRTHVPVVRKVLL